MSEFDKEKEREKLREKFKQEEERRETTQQMSELLLKGAKMLNVHCQECAAPIFQYEGEEFCPTCQRPADELPLAGPGDLSGPTVPSASSTDDPVDASDPSTDPEAADASAPSTSDALNETNDVASTSGATSVSGHDVPATPVDRPATSDDSAIASLRKTITELSERAAAAEDPRQAQELLAAASEAAETLRRLRDSGPR